MQAKLRPGSVDDPLEREAERAAQLVTRTPLSSSAGPFAPPHGRLAARTPTSMDGVPNRQVPGSVERVIASEGRPLEPTVQRLFDQRLGHDFTKVRVHVEADAAQSADEMNALAYTVGSHIVFGSGRYQPTSSSGAALLAHELVHTVQQSSSSCDPVVQRTPRGGSERLVRSLEDFAHGISELLLAPALRRPSLRGKGFFRRGPVLSVVQDDLGRFYIGLNEGVPDNLAEHLKSTIAAHNRRVEGGLVRVLHTDPMAIAGGHSETNALNKAIKTRELELQRVLTRDDVQRFELHNVWMEGDERRLTAAPRCEHCAGITKDVPVTDSVFAAEFHQGGGVSGTVDAAKARTIRAPVTPPPETVGKVRPSSVEPARTASGEINTSAKTPEYADAQIEEMGAEAEHAAAKSEGAAAKTVLEVEETALKAQAKFGSRAAAGALRGALSLLLPGPEDAIMLAVQFAGSYEEAWDIIEQRNTRPGIAMGIAAGMIGLDWEWVHQNLWRRFPTRDVATEFIGAVGKAERSYNDALARGYKYGAGHPPKMKNRILREAFTILAKEGYQTDEAGLFTIDAVARLAGLLLPVADDFLRQAAERKRAREKREEQESRKASRDVGNKI